MALVHVVGAGSIGTVLAREFARQGHPVTLLLRSAARADALAARQNRVSIEKVYGDVVQREDFRVASEVLGPPAPAAGGARALPPIRYLIVATKASQAVGAVRALRPRLRPDSVVVLVLNGVLGVYEAVVAGVFPDPAARPLLLLGSTTHGAFRAGDFRVLHVGHGDCVFGAPVPEAGARAASGGAAAEALGVLGRLEGLRPDVGLSPEELRGQLLRKLVVNCCANPLSALLHCRNGALVGNPAVEGVWRGVVAECKAVLGARVPGDEAELLAHVRRVVGVNAQNYNSMLQDVVAGAPTEVDFLNGYIVQHGRAQGRATPWNEALVAMVKGREACPPELLTKETL